MRNFPIDKLFPRFIGFENLFDELEMASNTSNQGYPPHNIIKIDDENYEIQLAVAGFKESDIDITLHNGLLKISGSKSTSTKDPQYVFQGIANRQFDRTFRLADHVEVKSANLEDGVLKVVVERQIPEDKKPKRIPIGESSSGERELLQEEEEAATPRSPPEKKGGPPLGTSRPLKKY